MPPTLDVPASSRYSSPCARPQRDRVPGARAGQRASSGKRQWGGHLPLGGMPVSECTARTLAVALSRGVRANNR